MSIEILIVDARKANESELREMTCDSIVDVRLRTVQRDSTVPNVGDVVLFNDHGLKQVFGSAIGKSFMKKMELTITHVDDLSMTYPEATFVVEVSDPEINQFLIDHHCFDIVRRAK